MTKNKTLLEQYDQFCAENGTADTGNDNTPAAPITKQAHALDEIRTQLPKGRFTRLTHLAKRLDVHAQTLRRWVKDGTMPKPCIIGGVALFSNDAILLWLEQFFPALDDNA